MRPSGQSKYETVRRDGSYYLREFAGRVNPRHAVLVALFLAGSAAVVIGCLLGEDLLRGVGGIGVGVSLLGLTMVPRKIYDRMTRETKLEIPSLPPEDVTSIFPGHQLRLP
jgi:hypothetical protein